MDSPAGDEIIERVKRWARAQDQIRVAILTGSRACKDPVDEFSDYDVALYGYSFEPFLYGNA